MRLALALSFILLLGAIALILAARRATWNLSDPVDDDPQENPQGNVGLEIAIGRGRREPSIQWNHIDGPVLNRGDGTLYWLSWADRFMLWRGKTTPRAVATKRSLRSGPWWRRLLCDLGHHVGHLDSDDNGMWHRCAFCGFRSGLIPWERLGIRRIAPDISPVHSTPNNEEGQQSAG